MQILYCSTLCSSKKLEELSRGRDGSLTGIAVQKFHRLVTAGLVACGAEVSAVTSAPVSGLAGTGKCIAIADDAEAGVNYHYARVLNLPVLRYFSVAGDTVRYANGWRRRNRGEQKVVVCDVLNISISIGALVYSFFSETKIIGLMTDMPGLMVGGKRRNGLGRIWGKVIKGTNMFILKRFDAYVFLTEAMNTVINTKHRPHIVMEGLVDRDMQVTERHQDPNVRTVIYAGGLHERYGVKMLIDAFRQVKGDNLRLSLYGQGPMVEDMPRYEEMDSRMKYLGMRPNREIVEAELKAVLMVNPRPTHEEFTKYSFPSKNMEYMVSGTPLLTMALPGMPQEYYDYVFVCWDESVEGLAKCLTEILGQSDEELGAFGQRAKSFVLEKKNNVKQAGRMVELMEGIL